MYGGLDPLGLFQDPSRRQVRRLISTIFCISSQCELYLLVQSRQFSSPTASDQEDGTGIFR